MASMHGGRLSIPWFSATISLRYLCFQLHIFDLPLCHGCPMVWWSWFGNFQVNNDETLATQTSVKRVVFTRQVWVLVLDRRCKELCLVSNCCFHYIRLYIDLEHFWSCAGKGTKLKGQHEISIVALSGLCPQIKKLLKGEDEPSILCIVNLFIRSMIKTTLRPS